MASENLPSTRLSQPGYPQTLDEVPTPEGVPEASASEGGSRSTSHGDRRRLYVPRNSSFIDDLPRQPTASSIHSSPISVASHNRESFNVSTQELDEKREMSRNPFLSPPQAHLSPRSSLLQRKGTNDLPTSSKSYPAERKATLASRLAPTIEHAQKARDDFAKRAKLHGYTLNAAIGLQVLLGSLTTGLSAAATSGKSAAVQTTILGGLSTIVASYLARARGSNEPELSNLRVKDLDQFIRDCQALSMDHGYDTTGRFDNELKVKRERFEELLGNASGERKLSSV